MWVFERLVHKLIDRDIPIFIMQEEIYRDKLQGRIRNA